VVNLPPLPVEARWHKSTFSSSTGCVEIAETPEVIGVRDTKDPEGPVLRFSPEEWGAFVAGVRNGEFDLA
jgi:Domain of unknown function (DUF397)